jgi:hypothetical protein
MEPGACPLAPRSQAGASPTAIDELAEEAGVEAASTDLVPFGCLSEPLHAPITHALELLSQSRSS